MKTEIKITMILAEIRDLSEADFEAHRFTCLTAGDFRGKALTAVGGPDGKSGIESVGYFALPPGTRFDVCPKSLTVEEYADGEDTVRVEHALAFARFTNADGVVCLMLNEDHPDETVRLSNTCVAFCHLGEDGKIRVEVSTIRSASRIAPPSGAVSPRISSTPGLPFHVRENGELYYQFRNSTEKTLLTAGRDVALELCSLVNTACHVAGSAPRRNAMKRALQSLGAIFSRPCPQTERPEILHERAGRVETLLNAYRRTVKPSGDVRDSVDILDDIAKAQTFLRAGFGDCAGDISLKPDPGAARARILELVGLHERAKVEIGWDVELGEFTVLNPLAAKPVSVPLARCELRAFWDCPGSADYTAGAYREACEFFTA